MDDNRADQDYIIKTGAQTNTFPVRGYIVVITYTKSLAVQFTYCLL